MPTGVIAVSVAIIIGGLLGIPLKPRISETLREGITMTCGVCSMSMGIATIVLMEQMPAVVFSILTGTVIGLLLHLGDRITSAAVFMQRLISRLGNLKDGGDEDATATLVTAIVLFCASGTGIYGAIISGMSGDHSILISKSFLDLITAAIFACAIGPVVALVAVPQFILQFLLFLLADIIFPLTTPVMINDFKACGGFIMLATGFRMMRLKQLPVADMLPAMIIVMPFSHFWSTLTF